MIEVIRVWTVNVKQTELIIDEPVILKDKDDLKRYRKELMEIHGKQILFTLKEK